MREREREEREKDREKESEKDRERREGREGREKERKSDREETRCLLSAVVRDGLIEEAAEVRTLGPAVDGVIDVAGVRWPVAVGASRTPGPAHVGDVDASLARQVPHSTRLSALNAPTDGADNTRQHAVCIQQCGRHFAGDPADQADQMAVKGNYLRVLVVERPLMVKQG